MLLISVPDVIYKKLINVGLRHSPFHVINKALEYYVKNGMPEVVLSADPTKSMALEYKIPHALCPIVDAHAFAGRVGRDVILLRALAYYCDKDDMSWRENA